MENVIKKDFFIYNAYVATLTAGSSGNAIISIEADANFVLVKTSYFADVAGAAQTDANRVLPLVDVTLLDSGSGRNLQDRAVPISSMAGTGKLPFVLPVPRTFKARSNLQVTFTNKAAVTDYANVQLSLIGYKVFSG